LNIHEPTTVDAAMALLQGQWSRLRVRRRDQTLFPMRISGCIPPVIVDSTEARPGLVSRTTATPLHRRDDRQRAIEFSTVVVDKLPVLRKRSTGGVTCRRVRAEHRGSIANADPAAELPMGCRGTRWRPWSCAGQGPSTIAASDLFQDAMTTRIAPMEIS